MANDQVLNRGDPIDERLSVVLFDDVKLHLDVMHDDDDGKIRAIVESAIEYFGSQVDSPFELTAYSLRLPWWPKCVTFPVYPLSSVTAVKYWPENGDAETTVELTEFETVIRDRSFGDMTPTPTADLPSLADRRYPVTVEFVAGYAPGKIPATVIHTIKLLARHYYDNPVPVVIGTSASDIPLTLQSMIAMHKPTAWVRGVK